MNIEKTWLTCREASVLLACSQRHVLNLIKKKNISVNRDESGKYFIDKAEFFRVYPDAMKVESDGNSEKSGDDVTMKVLEEKIRHLEEMVDEKKKQNDFLMGQIGVSDEKQSKMLDALNNHARLLEYKETGGKALSESSNKGINWWPFKRRS
jgi:hypothetical protein